MRKCSGNVRTSFVDMLVMLEIFSMIYVSKINLYVDSVLWVAFSKKIRCAGN